MEAVRQLRNERGLSQQRLADLAGINKVTLVHIEGDKTSPNVETLQKLADALGVEVADFFPKVESPLPFERARKAAAGSPVANLLREQLGHAHLYDEPIAQTLQHAQAEMSIPQIGRLLVELGDEVGVLKGAFLDPRAYFGPQVTEDTEKRRAIWGEIQGAFRGYRALTGALVEVGAEKQREADIPEEAKQRRIDSLQREAERVLEEAKVPS